MKNWHQFVFYSSKKAEGSKLSPKTRRKRDKNARNFNLTRAIGSLSMRVFETRTATGSELFPFNLSAHKHIYIAKYLFPIWDDSYKNLGDTTVLAREMFSSVSKTRDMNVRTYVRTSASSCMPMWPLSRNHITGVKFRAHREGNTPVDTVASLQHTSLILDINVLVNWHLSKQGIRWPVSLDHIAGLKLDLIEVSCFFLKLAADQGLVVDWIAG